MQQVPSLTVPEAIELASQYRRAGRTAQAVELLRRVVAVDPNCAEAHNNLGEALIGLGFANDAVAHLERSIALNATCASTYSNLGIALSIRGQNEAATVAFQRAIALDPQCAAAHHNLGIVQYKRGRVPESIEALETAIGLSPDYEEAHWALAHSLLIRNYDEKGWKEYEWRLRCADTALPAHVAPRWNGEPLPGGTLLVRGEQGFGDMLQFLRYIPAAKARSEARIIIECLPELTRLLRGNGFEVAARGESCGADVQIPIMSLPLALGVFEPLGVGEPYLRAHEEVEFQKAKWTVGFVWAGSPRHAGDSRRSIDPQLLAPLIAIPGVRSCSLQVGRPALAGMIDLAAGIRDFADTAALVDKLDLVITVDTAVAHLAGAMGKQVWMLLPFVPDWRWGLEGEVTPWYPTMRLFRQCVAGDWEKVIGRVCAELQAGGAF
ncbi:TPR repeat-containing protein [Chthoniobacter flavus Ellin428]|uniref:TPR repeat-containing protein n=1 Tax=Chthoniobacter flavus Ellin428 TaxID=497964 RepID=B4D9E0_9BACT|nr:tetratricopeptide repeat protein [Chthoniobacter flavus]EDY16901.1 TPR repeat-containing protein [Chthoniobacter flavus Ellin428]